MKSYRAAVAAMIVSSAAASARAQVGYPPARSPYRDLTYSQELTALFGYYVGRDDPAGVAPGNGPVTGVRYEWRAGGPAHLYAEMTRIGSTREVINPTKPLATRNLGERAWPLYTIDGGLAMSLTGAKSWHSLVPLIKTGIGVVSDFRSKPDTGGFRYGTRFALTWGAGVRYVPGGRFQLRGDITNRLNTISYPNSYFVASSGVPAVLTGASKSVWRNNPSFTIGLSYLFSR